jgi:hypothetical protein
VAFISSTATGEIVQIDAYAGRISRMRKRIHAWAEYLAPFVHDSGRFRLVMCTLTLAPENDWHAGMIRYYMKRVRRKLKDNLLGYAWVAELQKRGAVHYHVLLWVKAGTDVPKPDESGMWPWGSSRRETARTVYYICKYTSKGLHGADGKNHPTLPRGARIFAVWIAPNFTSEPRFWQFTLSKLPMWVVETLMAEYLYYTVTRGVGGYDISPPDNAEVKTHITSPWVFHLQ